MSPRTNLVRRWLASFGWPAAERGAQLGLVVPRNVPSGRAVIASEAQRRFPVQYLSPDQSALCLFGGFTKGRTELIHLREAGMQKVNVVEPNAERLGLVASNFPSCWRFTQDAPLEVCLVSAKAGYRYDLTIADGSRTTLDHLWEDLLPYLSQLTRKFAILRISGNYLEEYGLRPTSKEIAELAWRLHGLHLDVVKLVLRSSSDGGTHWAVVRTKRPTYITQTSASSPKPADSNLESAECICMTDGFGSEGCTKSLQCIDVVNSLRQTILNHEHSGVFRVYTRPRFLALPKGRISTHRNSAAILDLDRFLSPEDLWEQFRKSTQKRGTITRKISRAQKGGFFVRQFKPQTYLTDIYEINCSMPVRAGKPMRASYCKTVDEMRREPQLCFAPEEAECPQHNCTVWGVFKPDRTRTIGEIEINDKLVGYIYLRRCGNLARYSRILGHGTYLREGIMYLLHFQLVAELVRNRPSGLRYLQYTGMHSRGEDSGLATWKRHCLFEPKYIVYDDAGDWKGPDGMSFIGK